MDLALYDSEFGYYARAAQRSGRAGDFFTSVDVGALFGELLEIQIAEMADISRRSPQRTQRRRDESERRSATQAGHRSISSKRGAATGVSPRTSSAAARERDPELYDRTRLHLVELSADARAAQRATLGEAADKLATSSAALPSSFEGVLIANELLDAMPVHQVVMREEGLREVYVVEAVAAACASASLAQHAWKGRSRRRRSPSIWRVCDVSLEPGWRAEINLRALDWIREAASRLRRGFIILIDYGHEARELYSVTHAAGTLTTFARHTVGGSGIDSVERRRGCCDPGAQDMTAHVDFTSVRAAAEADGLETLGFLDQTYFLMGLAWIPRFMGSPQDRNCDPVVS